LTGLVRFSVASEIDMRRGYRRVVGDFSRYRADMQEPDVSAIDRDGLLEALRNYFAHRGVEPNWEAINRLADDALVVTLAMVCPFEPIEKQALLEAPSDAERVDTLLALLRMGAAEPPGPSDGPAGTSGDHDAGEHRRRLS
jgi:Lon protease-like protein